MLSRLRKVHPFRALFLWFSLGHRLTALVVITATIALAALGYSYSTDRSQSAASKRADADKRAFYACVPKYVSDLSRTNLPRTIASIQASNARFNWDVGFDKAHPDWTKAQLKAEYERLYRRYQKVIVSNPPLPAFTAKYCGDSAPTTPATTPAPAPATKKAHEAPAPNYTRAPASSGASHNGAGGSSGSTSIGGGQGPSIPTPSGEPSVPTLTGILLPGSTSSLLCAALPIVCGLRAP